MRPAISLDCDGVLADFAAGACEQIFAVTGRRYDPAVVTTWEVFHSVPQEVHVKDEVYARMKAPGGCFGLPVYPGTQEAVAALRELADITIVTSPFSGSQTWMHERELWLAAHFGFKPHEIIHARKKHAIHADIFIDDKEEHIQEWENYWHPRGHHGLGLLWHTGRNTSPHPNTKVVTDWATVIQLVKVYASAQEQR